MTKTWLGGNNTHYNEQIIYKNAKLTLFRGNV